jgi:hypothetical protein
MMTDSVREIRERLEESMYADEIWAEDWDRIVVLFAHIDKLEAKHYQLRVAAGRFLGQTSARNAQVLAKALEADDE